ncbi:MAG: aminopeptidase P N-terminal domain-containing protein [Deltaproteobacteria bacterium]|nr:aminopeptidase P N-terminal domain-containing protein [Deltaproteobacteria bacterium]
MDGGVAIFRAAPVSIRSHDVEYPFRQDNDFLYLTGFPEPEATCVLAPGAEHPFTLFVRPRDKDKEIWTGLRAGVDGAREIYGADSAHTVDELDARLPKLIEHAPVVYYAPGRDQRFNTRILDLFGWARDNHARSGAGPRGLLDPGTILHEMRLIKTPEEIEALERAITIAAGAHEHAMREARPGAFEYEIEALIDYTFRRCGATGPAYPSIVASGPNATILHYVENTRQMRDGELLLIDAGAEYGGYCADVTRTFPVGARFAGRQRDLYELVLGAQEAAIEAVRPGAPFDDPHRVALDVLVDGLLALGLLSGTRDAALESGTYRRFYMHRTSHWLGMDVHDVGVYRVDDRPRALAPGMVLTVEPGLYVAPDCEHVAPEWRGIGIRIEDDVLVTPEGNRVLSAAVPKRPDAIESARATSRG